MTEELNFPLGFNSCPHCGETTRILESIGDEQKEKGKALASTRFSLPMMPVVIVDPQKPALSAPVVQYIFDICAKCGAVYCVWVDKRDIPITAQMIQPPSQPGSQGHRRQGFPFTRG